MTANYINTCLITCQQNDNLYILVNPQNQLPQVETTPHFWQDCETVNHAIREQYDIDVLTLRCLSVDFKSQPRHYVYSMVYQTDDMTTGEWVTAELLPKDAKQYWDMAQEIHPNQPYWYTQDGYQRLYDSFPIADIEQVRSWGRSSVWRIHTNGQTQYLKLIPDMFNNEARLTQWLAQQFPDNVLNPQSPFPSAMLTPEYRGEMLSRSVEMMCKVLVRYAEIQIQTIDNLDTLEQIGVLQRDMTWITDHAEMLLADDDALKIGSNPLTDDEIQKLREAIPMLQPHFGRLMGVEALEHGDLHHGQIFVDDEHITFTDFSDATITHPFFSLVYFLWNVEDKDLAHDQIISAYFDPFSKQWSMDRCHQMYTSAKIITPLFSALRYYVDILPKMAYPWEMENMLAFNLRILLEAFD